MKKNLLKRSACILLCSAMLFSFIVLVLEAEHDCVGEACHICLEIQHCQSLLKSLARCIGFFAFHSALLYGSGNVLQYICCEFRHETPVVLNVKLLN